MLGITNTNKTLSTSAIGCGESFRVALSLTAEPDIVSNPTDIVLVLDRSGSMEGSALESLKEGANAFIDIIDEATDGTQDGQLGGGSRIGIVSFATAATQDTQLITSVADLKAAVDGLDAGGNTNHADAFTKAVDLFDPTSANAKVMVMFTDGVTTVGPDPSPIAAAAKAQGIIIYAIGLNGNGGIDVTALENWASDPSSAYVAIAPTEAELLELFENLARNIVNPGATDIVLTDQISDCFRITGLSSPTKGTATLVDATTVRWEIDELGVTQSEGAMLEFTVEHLGTCSGNIEVNTDISYSDAEGNVVTFPSPEISVDCGTVITEPCPDPVAISVSGCSDVVEIDAGRLDMQSLGRIVQLDVTLENVCPDRRVALAVSLVEVDDEDNEYPRGMKILTIPAHDGDTCRDVTVRCIKFILPEDLDVSGSDAMCNERNFRAQFLAHYVDSGFICCED